VIVVANWSFREGGPTRHASIPAAVVDVVVVVVVVVIDGITASIPIVTEVGSFVKCI